MHVRNSRIQDEVFPGVEGLGMRGLFQIFPRLGIPDFRFWGVLDKYTARVEVGWI